MTENKKHIVLLTTWYPPIQSIASYRMEAFAKYLDHDKFGLTIVTLGNDKVYGSTVEAGIRIFRIKPKGGFWMPKFKSTDSKFWHYAKVAWKKVQMKLKGDELDFYVKQASDILNELHTKNPIDLIISSFSPAAPHLAALDFCKKNSIKWIVDMRDEMSLNPQSDPTVRKYYASIEKEIAQYASALTSVSQPIVEYFKTVIPNLKEYVEIRNGFDHDMVSGNYNFNSCFTLLHAGSFYGTRKPDTLIQALQNLAQKGQLPEKWKLSCAGAVKNFHIPESLRANIEIIERVDHERSLDLMAEADLNILIQPPTGRKGVFTGKLFEYISVQKPVLAIVDEGDVAAELVLEMKAGFVAPFYNIQAIEEALLKIIKLWQNKEQLHANPELIKQLHRKYQVQKLNLLIEKLLDEK